MISYNQKHKIFYWVGPFESRHVPKDAGFEWSQKYKTWLTKSPYIAYQLIGEADNDARFELTGIDNNIFDSKQPNDIFNRKGLSVPKGLSYLPFQIAGITHLVSQLEKRRSVLLADEQGLGKTVQAIGVANHFGFKKILVICPASLRLNWAREIEKWHIHNPGVKPLLSGKDAYDPQKSAVVSYHLAGKVEDYEPDFIIIDEGHYLKNRDTKRTQYILGVNGLIEKAPSIILTGTPLPNGKPNELYPILRKCAPECINYMSYWDYVRHFCELDFGNYRDYRIIGAKNQKELFTRLRGSGFMTRRLKKDVLKDLPPKRHKMVVFPASGGLKKILDKESEFDALEIARHGVPVGSGLPEIRREMGIEKVPVTVEYISNLLDSGTEKLIVFAHHIEVVDLLSTALKKYNPVVIKGDTPAKTRQYYVDLFQTDPLIRIAVGNLQSMGTGWTLTSAHDVVFVEASWVPGENDQCADRAHRIGQNERVMLHFLVVEGSIDARILGSAALKARDSKGVLDG